jgi:ketosteroid isomerase-like protein
MEHAAADVLDAARRWVLAAQARDANHVLAHSADLDPAGVHTFASGPDTDLTLHDLVEHMGAYPPILMEDIGLAGWVRGDVAWATGTAVVRLPDGEELAMRMTVVLVDDAGWKVAHFHLSEGVPHDV